MRLSGSILILLGGIFTNCLKASEITIYRWVDENNTVHFSQDLPKNSNYSQLTTTSSYQAKKNVLSKNAPHSPVDAPLTPSEKNDADVIAKNKEIIEKNCQTAKRNVKTLNATDEIMMIGTNGKNIVLSDKEKNAQRILAEEDIRLYCNE